MKQDVSNELLGAFVDDELACSDKRVIAEEIKTNADMASRTQALLDLKTSIKQAYPESEVVEKTNKSLGKRFKKRFLTQSIAASVMVSIGLIIGSIFGQAPSQNPYQPVTAGDSIFGIKVQPVSHHANKVLLHITSSELNKIDFLLSKTERMLLDSKNSNNPLNIEVIANSGGIDFLKKTNSPYAERILSLQQQYDNLQFIACKNTLRRLRKNGNNIQMVDGVKQDRPALDTIVNRMNDGWTYVKI